MKVNLGSGAKKGVDGWITIDHINGADIKTDIRKGIPLKSNSAVLIYSSHFFEHLNFEDICNVLKECLRVLNHEGQISICVPDTKKYINAYLNGLDASSYIAEMVDGQRLKIPDFLSPGEVIHAKAVINTGSAIDWLNYIAYSGGEHKYMFDKQNLESHLKLAGFICPIVREFNPEIDDVKRKGESLYIDAFKPKKLVDPK